MNCIVEPDISDNNRRVFVIQLSSEHYIVVTDVNLVLSIYDVTFVRHLRDGRNMEVILKIYYW